MTEKKLISPAWLQPVHVAIILFLIAIIYFPSLDVPFIFDDFPNIVNNPYVQPEHFKQISNAIDSQLSSTRPLAMISFALNYWFDGLDVFGYHLVNIIIHLLNALLIYKIIITLPVFHKLETNRPESIYYRYNLAFWSALLWAVNPVQTQAVTYIVQRMTSMATFFYLAAIFIFLLWQNKSLKTGKTIIFTSACFILGMASKEIIITLPFTLLLIDFLFYHRLTRQQSLSVLFLIIASMLLLGLFYLDGKLPDWFTKYPNRNFSPWEKVMTEWRVVWHYLSVFILPLPDRLHLAYDTVPSRALLLPWTTLAGLLAMLGSWVFAWKIRSKYPAIAFAIFFFFLALSVESTFVNIELAFIHRLYLPSVFLVFALLAFLPPKLLRRAGIILLVLVAVWSFWTISRNVEYNQPASFWDKELNRGAGVARALNNRAASFLDQGETDNAIQVLREGLNLGPEGDDRISMLYNLALAYYLKGDLSKSLKTFKELQEQAGGYRDALAYVGHIYIAQGRIEDAKELAALLKAEKGENYQGIIIEANIAKEEKNYEEAERLLLQSLKNEAEARVEIFYSLKQELADLYLRQGKVKEAYDSYLDIIKLYPNSFGTWKRIYYMLEAGNDRKNSEIIRRFLQSKGIEIERRQIPDKEELPP